MPRGSGLWTADLGPQTAGLYVSQIEQIEPIVGGDMVIGRETGDRGKRAACAKSGLPSGALWPCGRVIDSQRLK